MNCNQGDEFDVQTVTSYWLSLDPVGFQGGDDNIYRYPQGGGLPQ
jgi:hypothetical protein